MNLKLQFTQYSRAFGSGLRAALFSLVRTRMALITVAAIIAITLCSLSSGTSYADYLYYGSGTGGVGVIDTTTNTQVKTIPFNGDLLTISPDGNYLYVLAETVSGVTVTSSVLNVISCIDGTLAASVNLGTAYVWAINIDSSGQFVYLDVANLNISSAYISSVVVVGTATNTINRTITLPFPAYGQLYISPDEKHAYAINYNDATQIGVIDLNSGDLLSTFTLHYTDTDTSGNSATATWQAAFVNITPDSSRAYVSGVPVLSKPLSNFTDNTLALEINTTSNAIVGNLQAPPEAYNFNYSSRNIAIAFSHDSQTGALFGPDNFVVPIFNTTSNAYTTIWAGGNATNTVNSADFTSDNQTLYITGWFRGVSSFNLLTNQWSTIVQQDFLGGLAIGPPPGSGPPSETAKSLGSPCDGPGRCPTGDPTMLAQGIALRP
jgi:hypothetical protein